jgi:hypothetical protein
MAYDFLGLTNDIARRLNETELTAANFATATGVFSQLKDSVNAAIRDINQSHFAFPFNHNFDTITLTAGQLRYPLPTNSKYVDFDTVRLQRSTTPLVESARKLTQLSYDEYVSRFIDEEYKTASQGSAPEYVVRAQDSDIIFAPIPDAAYSIKYEYYMFPADLTNATDVPTIPFRYRHVIVDGGMYYAYMFRDNLESARVSFQKFESGIKRMRVQNVNENVYARAI